MDLIQIYRSTNTARAQQIVNNEPDREIRMVRPSSSLNDNVGLLYYDIILQDNLRLAYTKAEIEAMPACRSIWELIRRFYCTKGNRASGKIPANLAWFDPDLIAERLHKVRTNRNK